jgi:hypothetical protein
MRPFYLLSPRPIRWDEWLPFMTTRIAPFRTRTLHSPQYFHTLPTPNAVNLPNARSSLPHPLSLDLNEENTRSMRQGVGVGEGHRDGADQGTGMRVNGGEGEEAEERTMDPDSILSLLPTVARMMRCLQPQIDAAARIAVEVSLHSHHSLLIRFSDEDLLTNPVNYVATDMQVLRSDPEAGDADLTDSRDRDFRRIAEDLCPLADRFGRILADLSPLLRALGSSAAPALSPMGTGISPAWGTSNPLSPDYFPAPEHPSNNMLEMSLASLLRPRSVRKSVCNRLSTICSCPPHSSSSPFLSFLYLPFLPSPVSSLGCHFLAQGPIPAPPARLPSTNLHLCAAPFGSGSAVSGAARVGVNRHRV